jgi:hypothetical protein
MNTIKIGITFYGLRQVASSGCNMCVLIGKKWKEIDKMKHRGVRLKRRHLESVATHGNPTWTYSLRRSKDKLIASEPIQNKK